VRKQEILPGVSNQFDGQATFVGILKHLLDRVQKGSGSTGLEQYSIGIHKETALGKDIGIKVFVFG